MNRSEHMQPLRLPEELQFLRREKLAVLSSS
jgi:hypothetical protein